MIYVLSNIDCAIHGTTRHLRTHSWDRRWIIFLYSKGRYYSNFKLNIVCDYICMFIFFFLLLGVKPIILAYRMQYFHCT